MLAQHRTCLAAAAPLVLTRVTTLTPSAPLSEIRSGTKLLQQMSTTKPLLATSESSASPSYSTSAPMSPESIVGIARGTKDPLRKLPSYRSPVVSLRTSRNLVEIERSVLPRMNSYRHSTSSIIDMMSSNPENGYHTPYSSPKNSKWAAIRSPSNNAERIANNSSSNVSPIAAYNAADKMSHEPRTTKWTWQHAMSCNRILLRYPVLSSYNNRDTTGI